jgi:hypothetical protein
MGAPCRVTFEGKVFFKPDFIKRVLDTLHLEDNVVENSKYLKSIGYENSFNEGDPILIREKKEEAKEQAKEEKKPLTSREIDIKRQELEEKKLEAKRRIARADDTELAIEEYNNAKKAEDDFEAELEKVKAKKRVDSLIEDEKESYENDSRYEYKELFEKDPRLAALQSHKDMLDYVKSDSYIENFTKLGISDVKERQEDSIKRNEEYIADLEADLKENPPTKKATSKAETSIFDDLDASRVSGAKAKQVAANKEFAEKYGENAAVARAISANFEAIANELKSKGIFIDIDCK